MSPAAPRPYSLLAELTHRCPLHCPYCSNPTRLASPADELTTAEWQRVFNEAAALGALHVGFSGGEPLQRQDLTELAAAARSAGLYSNLITSGLGLTQTRAEALKKAGLDSIQISFQSDEPALADQIAGAAAHHKKLEVARLVRALGFPLTVNVVLHCANIGRLPQIIALAEDLHAERLELANAQYYGWAFRNRHLLLPTREQVETATQVATAAKQRLLGKMEILFVVPDYYSDRPKPCMHGWGNRHITVNPIGEVLPCPTAGEIKGLRFDNVRSHPLGWIWAESEAFTCFRGTDWMPEPCRSCEFREVDFGGCRCQAALLTGNPAVTDPACSLSPHRHTLTRFVESIGGAEMSSEHLKQAAFRENPQGAHPLAGLEIEN
jgi:pyrroloquinoline quinone biosynthesis protein E